MLLMQDFYRFRAGTLSACKNGALSYKIEFMQRQLNLVASTRRIGQTIDSTAQLFLYLQLLDFITTVLGFRLGLAEASPFICFLMHAGPVAGVLVSKLLALALGGACLYLGKRHLLRWVSYWYAGLVVWNLFVIFSVLGRVRG